MGWKKYYLLIITVIVIIFTIVKLSYDISFKEQEISEIIKIQKVLNQNLSNLNDFKSFNKYLNEKEKKDKLNSLYNKLNNDLKNLSIKSKNIILWNYNYLDDSSKKIFLLDTILTSDYYMERQNFLVVEIKNIKIIRDSLFYIFLLFLFICLVFEFLILKNEISYINRCFRNLLYKKYDEEFKYTSLPYMNQIVDNMNRIKTELKILDETTNLAMKGYGLNSALQELYNNPNFRKYMKFDRIGLATVDESSIIAEMNLSEGSDIKLKKGFKIDIANSKSLKNLIETKEIRIINNLKKYYEENPNSTSTKLLLEEEFMSSLTFPICKYDGKVIGFLFFSSKNKNTYNEIDKVKINSVGKILSYIFERNMIIEDLISNSALTFVKLVEGKDPETSKHIDRMAHYAKIIAKQLSQNSKYEKKLDYSTIDEIYRYAPLHDIGKVGIPDNILLKPGKLTIEEFNQMKEHTKIGAKILSYYKNNMRKYDLDFFDVAIKIAIGHHEKWDGTGYPNNLKGEQIPIEARIVALADVFDALSSKRIYKEAFSFEESIKIINELSGIQFSPDVVTAFNECKDKIEAIYTQLKEN